LKTIGGNSTKKDKDTMAKVLMTIIGCAIVAVLGGLAFIYSGIYDVSATTPDSALVSWAVHKVSDTSVGARLGANHPPTGLDQPKMISAGGRLFVENCAVCHGAPGVAQTNIAKGLNPSPPDLFRAGRKPDPAENFQFIKYGVKMTAMPGFAPTLSDDEIWSLVAFLNGLPGISASDYAAKTAPASGG
jgi:mono/diheme cytochrome c family protein